VDCVESGQKAIDLIKGGKTKYSAVFMDHMMPEMDGFEAVRIIRSEIESEYAKTVPIIALTANAILGNEDLFLKNGFQAFLSKPIDIIRLDMIINRYVRDKKLELELAADGKAVGALRPKAQKENTPGLLEGRALNGIDFIAGLKRFENNEEMYLGIVSSYFSQMQLLTEKIRSHTEETLGDYKIAVHSLKSTSYTIGAKQIGSMAEGLEKAATSGNIEFVNANNPALIEALENLRPALGSLLEEIKNAEQKPVQQKPDPAALVRLLNACINYDMEQLDAVMDELEQYNYESQGDLVEWLRKEIDKSELESIREKLESLNIRIGGEESGR
jgi:CheY-like chemotaxis protein